MSSTTSKRKRDSMDQGGPTPPPVPVAGYTSMSPHDPDQSFDAQYLHHSGENDLSLAEALAQHNAGGDPTVHDTSGSNGQSATDTASAALHYSMTVPVTTESTFLNQATSDGVERPSDTSFDVDTSGNAQDSGTYPEYSLGSPKDAAPENGETRMQEMLRAEGMSLPGAKPAVGSMEWHKIRRNNHKEVERRRREQINEGITELSKIVPGCEKNKGSILARTVQFITQLKENESQNIEKWTLEKLLTEQAIAELSSSCDKLKTELKSNFAELAAWERAGRRAGFEVTDEDREATSKEGDGEE